MVALDIFIGLVVVLTEKFVILEVILLYLGDVAQNESHWSLYYIILYLRPLENSSKASPILLFILIGSYH